MIIRSPGRISVIQRLRTLDFSRFAALGLSERWRLATPLGNCLFMQPPPLPV
jgi:hypothetical protein